MCSDCNEYSEDNKEWEWVGCDCMCTGQDVEPGQSFDDGSEGDVCGQCGHRIIR